MRLWFSPQEHDSAGRNRSCHENCACSSCRISNYRITDMHWSFNRGTLYHFHDIRKISQRNRAVSFHAREGISSADYPYAAAENPQRTDNFLACPCFSASASGSFERMNLHRACLIRSKAGSDRASPRADDAGQRCFPVFVLQLIMHQGGPPLPAGQRLPAAAIQICGSFRKDALVHVFFSAAVFHPDAQ